MHSREREREGRKGFEKRLNAPVVEIFQSLFVWSELRFVASKPKTLEERGSWKEGAGLALAEKFPSFGCNSGWKAWVQLTIYPSSPC